MPRLFVLFVAIVFAASASAAGITFVSPLRGAQLFGPSAIEIQTDAANVNRVEFYVDGVLAGVARQAPWRIAFDFGSTLAARNVTAKVWSNGFQTVDSATVLTAALTANETLDVDLVEVPVRVRSRSPLTARDLRIRENGVTQTIRDVRRERPPAHFAFVVDRSLSMSDGKLAAALGAIERELTQLREGDTASLVLFNHHVGKPLQIAPGARLDVLARDAAPSGGTSLRDALASVAGDARTYAIAITDGGDRNSVLSEEDALRVISGTRTVVQAIVLGRSHTRLLDRAAANTGGAVVTANGETLRSALASILSDINSRYLVIYQSHGTRRGWRTIDVRTQRRGVELLAARKGYFAR